MARKSKSYTWLKNNVEVKRYSYRQKMVEDIVFDIDRDSDEGQELENQLLEATGAKKDNDIVFETTSENGQKLYIWAYDFMLRIGHTLTDKKR